MNKNNLVRLAYFSTAEKSFSNEELLTMLTYCREKNEQFNIGGLLVYCDDCFFQVIEGNEKEIDQLWGNIQKDDRHSLATRILKCPIKQKSYADWSMAFTHFRNANEIYVDGFKDLLELYQSQKIDPACDNKIAEIIHKFSETQ